jgi:sterol desaturase/sphingolipid hydroxylase (fatty acid hydroxylase superfamily)
MTLLDCARTFIRRPSPKVIGAAIGLALAARLAIGEWSWLDLAVVAMLIGLQPFNEWLIHVGLLHSKPRRLGPFTIDLPTARLHRWHHRNPTVLETVLIPAPLIAALFLLIMATMWLLSWPLSLIGGDHSGLFLTACLAGFMLVGSYEWCHFLIHTAYRPRSTYYKGIWRSHRLHHFKNEHYWFGVSSDAADRVLGTSPDHRSVPKSRTARNLGARSPVGEGEGVAR